MNFSATFILKIVVAESQATQLFNESQERALQLHNNSDSKVFLKQNRFFYTIKCSRVNVLLCLVFTVHCVQK